ncbi:Ubiquitin-conjugating enzyme family protein [Achlya hypogyna]|uniref:Ubiquitin-conjugating enzyme family protein n=1 Tax=Achlya hypogyna TaxID=1202772 RepID=A0A1V9YUR1_ACHHY|nr:Ubiquitin-conjugating enzyme family protein [Achlya hypogyna]
MSSLQVAFRHFQQYLKAPVPGCTIAHVEDNIFHVSTLIRDGIFEGITVHWELSIPPTYPHSPPFGRVLPSYAFRYEHHSHVFEDGICVDVLANHEYMHQSAARYGGWTPSSNFIMLMIYMQAFLADPDYATPSSKSIDQLRAMDKAFCCNDCGQTNAAAAVEADLVQAMTEAALSAPPARTPHEERVRRELICPIMQQNIVDHTELCLGYPLLLDTSRNRPELSLFPEFMSKAAVDEARAAGVRLRTPTGQAYTHWLPLFLTPTHFENHKALYFASVERLAYLDVLLKAMNTQVVAVMQGNEHESEAAIVAYANLLRLAQAYLVAHPSEQASLNREVREFVEQPEKRTKAAVPNLGEFFIKVCLATTGNHGLTHRETKAALFGEHFARQVRWIRQEDAACVNFGTPCTNRLGRLFVASATSNRLLTFAIEMSKTFGGADFGRQMDAHLGLPPLSVLQGFQGRIKRIKTSLTNYSVLMQAWDYGDVVRSPDEMLAVLQAAVAQSAASGYDGNSRSNHHRRRR